MKKYATVLITICLCACNPHRPVKTGLEGKPLPVFSLLPGDSTETLNTANFTQGNPIVFILFSPYCPYCRAEIKEITEEMDKLHDIQFCLVTRFPRRMLKKFYQEYHLEKYPNVAAGVDTGNFLSTYFKVPYIPYTAIYSKNKTLNNAYIGRILVSEIKSVAGN